MKNRMDDLLPPSPKRAKSENSLKRDKTPQKGTTIHNSPSTTATKTTAPFPTSLHPLSSDVKTEFPVRALEDFYKPCPSFRLPIEIGAFSLDHEGEFQLDRTQLRYYVLPAHPTRPNFDLNIGFSQFVPNKRNVPSNKLDPILRWISQNGDCFRPRSQPLSPGLVGKEIKSKLSEGQSAPKNGVMGTDERSTNEDGSSLPASPEERPDNLLTNFVTWRGMITKMMCSPYNKTEPWCVAATRHNGTIYLSEIETEEAKEHTRNQTPRMEQMCYWGLKFEDYITNKDPAPLMKPTQLHSNPSTPVTKPGTVNPKRAYCTVVRTRMNTHSVVMAAEVDCCDHQSKEKPPRNYIELKTSRVILTDRNKSSFKRYKLMKWWAQSFLVGVPKIICGFRDDEGIVRTLQTFRTSEIPHETQTDLTMWQPAVCLNYLDDLLNWIRKVVSVDDSRTVYLLEWRAPYTCVTCTQCPPNSEHQFLPNWYLSKQSPPEE